MFFFRMRWSSLRSPTHLFLSWSLSARIRMEGLWLLEGESWDAVT